MAQDNQLSATLSVPDLEAITQAVEAIQARLPFLVNLTPEERQAYARLGDRSLAFVEKALAYARENPGLVPPYLNVAEFERDMALIGQLQSIARPLRSLVEALEDTLMLGGSESYSAALTFYASVRTAQRLNVAGTKTIYEALRARFPGHSAPEEPVVPAAEASDGAEEATPPV
jgi:hypothetical protein